MTKGWEIFGSRLESAIQNNIVVKLKNQIVVRDDNNYNLGKIPNLHSLIPYSLEAKKPVFDCTASDGLKGGHCTKAKKSVEHFKIIVDAINNLVKK
jgi:hypothetical protein